MNGAINGKNEAITVAVALHPQALMCMKKRKLLDTQHGQILSQIMLLFTQRNGLDSMNMQARVMLCCVVLDCTI